MLWHRIAAATALWIALLCPAARANANSLVDALGPRELALGESMRADATGSLATTLNPAGLPLSRSLVLETGYGYRPDDGASLVAVSACDSTVPVPGCFYYHYFRASPDVGGVDVRRRSHEVGYVIARRVGSFVFGAKYKYFDYNFSPASAGDDDASGHAADFGMTFVAGDSVRVGVVSYNLVSTADSPQYPRAFGGGLVVRPAPSLSIAVDAAWNTDLPDGQDTGRYSGGVEYFIVAANRQAGYPLRAGVVYDDTGDRTYATGGLGYVTPKVGIDIGVRKQVGGDGDELLVVGSLRLFAPQQ
ncbi:MAG: hypothetical protein D6689_15485 [Deltaproteobacteria bacterium]|nr:MAG: hypothetical protein D6689_15485 [Deltaproteobacteria bacterium]